MLHQVHPLSLHRPLPRLLLDTLPYIPHPTATYRVQVPSRRDAVLSSVARGAVRPAAELTFGHLRRQRVILEVARTHEVLQIGKCFDFGCVAPKDLSTSCVLIVEPERVET